MPPRTLSHAEWVTVVNHIAQAQHLLTAMPRAPQLDASILATVRELDETLQLLGFDPQNDQGELRQFFAERIPPVGSRPDGGDKA